MPPIGVWEIKPGNEKKEMDVDGPTFPTRVGVLQACYTLRRGRDPW
jgi:hypothetical protein